ncbi:MAG: hypothetical protein EOP21_01265 [Hyphomicrobiales bacterium]|nr:MAG: hypothetical protein EOP21_01265 [Hyphomicrobiales bacterium]
MTVTVAYFAMEEKRRAELNRFWATWSKVIFLAVMLVNSLAGIYLFVNGPTQIVRADVSRLLLHVFNLTCLPVIVFMSSMLKVMDKRDARRKEADLAVAQLQGRLAALEAKSSIRPAELQLKERQP